VIIMNMRLVALLCSGSLAATACAPTSPESSPVSFAQLTGAKWVAEDIDGHGVIDDAQSTVQFVAPDRIAGRGGCNQYSGNVTMDGTKIQVSPLISTKMACVPALMDQESRFLQALEAARSLKLQETKLLVLDESGATRLRLDRQ
jgi:heat shock protein HslJ